MERYESYKDSGVKWLGQIPSHWEVVKLKSLCKMFGRIGFRGYSRDDLVDKGEGAITLSPSNFSDGHLDFSNCSYLSWDKYYESPEIMVNNGDLLFVKTASIGKVAYVDNLPIETTVNPQILVLKDINCNAKYLNYYLQTKSIQGWIVASANGSTISTISQVTIGNYPVILPPQEVQTALVKYIDTEMSKIDAAIAQQQKMIDLLNERKQIIINNAVTKGLDPNIKIKPSGVDWIGNIPEHWEVKRGKYLFKIISDLSTTGDEELLSVSDKTGVTPRSMKNITMFMAESLIGYKRCKIGDVCSNIMWMWHGAVGVTKYEGVISPSYGVYRQIKQYYLDDYLDFLLRLPQLVKLYSVLSTGLTESRLRLYPSDFMGIFFMVPPIEEQKRIVEYVNKVCDPINSIIDSIEKQISLLQERKQIIINDVVTGKVKVV